MARRKIIKNKWILIRIISFMFVPFGSNSAMLQYMKTDRAKQSAAAQSQYVHSTRFSGTALYTTSYLQAVCCENIRAMEWI